jgi:PAS domain S-box-containing protein
VVDNIPSGILTADMLGRLSLINDTACTILGVRREEVTGLPVEKVLGGLEMSDSRGEHRLPRSEIFFRRADGAEIFLGFRISMRTRKESDRPGVASRICAGEADENIASPTGLG